MNTEINLLPQKNKKKISRESMLTLSKVVAVSMLVLTVSFSLLFFLLNRDPTLANIQAQENTVLAKLTLLHSKTAKELIILDRIKRIANTLTLQGSLDKTIGSLEQQIPSNVTVTSFSLQDKNITLTLSSPSLVSIGKTIDNFTSLVKKKTFLAGITIQGVITDEKGGNYLVTITGTLL